MIESGPLLVAIYGTLLGARHALEPDHLAAVSTMAAHGRSRADVLRVSGAWGAGHASLIVIAGTLITLLGWEIPRNFAGRADTLVGLALVVVGAWTLAGVRRDRIHVHPHVHGSQPPHAHFHLHPHSAEHSVHPQPPDWLRRPAAAYAVGTLHGARCLTVSSPSEDIVTTVEEQRLIALINAVKLSPFRYRGWLGKRLTASFGCSSPRTGCRPARLRQEGVGFHMNESLAPVPTHNE